MAPTSHLPGVDQVVQGMSGLMSVTGEPGRGPMRVGIAICDIVTGLYAAIGMLTATIERQKSGQGQWVQASLLESQMFTMDLQAARYLVDGTVPKQVGNEHPSGAPTNAYKTKDGYVNIAPIPVDVGQALQGARPRGPDRSSGLCYRARSAASGARRSMRWSRDRRARWTPRR